MRLAGLVLVFVAFSIISSANAFAARGVVAFYGGTGAEGNTTEGNRFSIFHPQFGGGLAINQAGTGGASAGDFYVTDSGNNRIQVLSPDGAFVRAFGLDAGGPGVDVCTEAASCAKATASGAAGALSGPQSVAVDQSNGNVFVTDYGNRRVDVFSATGAFEGAFGWNVKAVGGAEELQFCTAETGCKVGTEGAGAGEFAPYVNSGLIGAVAVNPTNGHILVTSPQNRRVDEFAPSLTGGVVTGVSFVRGYGWGAVDGSGEFQICTTVCHAPYEPSEPASEVFQPGLGELGPGTATSIAVTSSGSVLVGDSYYDRVERFSPNGNPEGPLVDYGVRGGALSQVAYVASSNSVVIFGGDSGTSSTGGYKVREFDLSGNETGEIDLGEINTTLGLAVHEATGDLYLAGVVRSASERESQAEREEHREHESDAEREERREREERGEGLAQTGVIRLGTTVPPTVSIDAPTGVTGTAAAFSGTVNPQGFFASYRFEYSVNGGIATVLSAGELPADSNDHAASGAATGLEAHTEYQLRLVAEKALNGGSAKAETTFLTGAAVPIASATTATAITTTSATLEGTVNPEREATTYRFQCVTQAGFEASEWATAIELPVGGETLGPAGEDVAVSQAYTGLSPLSRYRCRLLATNGTGEGEPGAATTFVTYAPQGSALPDGRAYEQATPVGKNGSGAEGASFLVKAAEGGDKITYFISGGGSTGEGSQDFPTYVADREGDTWVSHGLLPASIYGDHAEVKGWSEDLARDYPLVWSSGTKATFYVRDNASGALRPIATGVEPFTGAYFAAESTGGANVLFESTSALTAGARQGVSNLYVWNRASGALTLVDVLPSGSTSLTGAFAGSYKWAEAAVHEANPLENGGAQGYEYTQELNVLSADGSTAFFTSAKVGQVYARRNLASPAADTVQVSASQKDNGSGSGGKDPQGPKPAAFMEATPDGHYVFFSSQSELTNDATTGSADQGNDLYRYDTQSGALIDVAPDSADANGAEVQVVLGSSPDGSTVYFLANGALAEGATPGDCTLGPATGFNGKDQASSCNIYVSTNGVIKLVSRIGGGQLEASNFRPSAVLGGGVPQRGARVDGDTVIFTSSLPITGYDNGGKQEIYRYDPTEGLLCISCIPSGQGPPINESSLFSVAVVFGAPLMPNSFQLRNVTDGGKRVFFESDEKLVPTDVNGVRDVYEWETAGTGSCTSTSQNGGCVYLISTGTSPQPSYFADASASGNDVFIFTKQQLVGQDTDELVDIYDARVGGGIAAQNPLPSAPCQGEACKGPAALAPGGHPTGTATFAGPGNPKQEVQCHKGFARRHGKCVRKHHKRHHHKNRRHHHHKKHGNKHKHGKQSKHRHTNRGQHR